MDYPPSFAPGGTWFSLPCFSSWSASICQKTDETCHCAPRLGLTVVLWRRAILLLDAARPLAFLPSALGSATRLCCRDHWAAAAAEHPGGHRTGPSDVRDRSSLGRILIRRGLVADFLGGNGT